MDRKNEQTTAILNMQGARLAELEVLYKEEQVLRKRYSNTIEGWHFLKPSKLSAFSTALDVLVFIFIMSWIIFINDMSKILSLWYISDMKGKIRVFCRLRPLNEKEIAEKERDVLTSLDEFTVEHPWKDDKAKQHIYDHVLGDLSL